MFMKTNLIKIATLSVTSILLCACNGFFDKDNTPPPTPLTSYRPEAQVHKLWTTFANFGEESDYLKLVPAVGSNAIFTASKDGSVTAVTKEKGKTLWKKIVKAQLSAGPTADNGLVFIGSRGGHVIALNANTGDFVWQTSVSSEVLSPPAAGDGVVVIKTIDGELTALSENDGHALWHYHQTEPALILRGGSTPVIEGSDVIAGFENGNLAKLTLSEGSMIWQTTVALPQGSFAIQRMVDIDADPVIYNHTIYVATYQGKVAALELGSGKVIWSHDMSSFTGITVDNERVYVSDAKSYLWAFDRESGTVDWRQPQLEARIISGPALINNYVAVGDGQGYLHFLSKTDGHFIARARVSNAAIRVAPVVENGVIYVLTREGYLSAYNIS
jgi:outer membrane protein assembly factor BamB